MAAPPDAVYLLARAARILENMGCESRSFAVIVLPDPPPGGHRSVELRLTRCEGMVLPAIPGEAAPVQRLLVAEGATAPAGFRRLSPTEADILAILRQTGGWLTTADLAAQMKREPTSELRCIIRSLAEAGELETCQRRGLRLTGRDSRTAEAG